MLFQAYKSKQGLYARWTSFVSCALLFLFGVYRLYWSFPTSDERWGTFSWAWAHNKWYETVLPLVDITVAVTPRLTITIACGAFCLILFAFLTFRHERISEFLIDTESEMRKVSWPTTKDVVKSSFAVIVMVILLGLFLYVSDIVLSTFFGRIF